ncbi:MAG: L-threonylcarbamoyladenylate synthase [Candidatus Pacearchaeota archaeon]
MKTKIFNLKQIEAAAELIKNGELVAFPTETVYGLGGNALDPKAIKKIFYAKGRPKDNPLIIHIGKKEQLYEIAEIKDSQKKIVNRLISKFWPGPLTIILKKKKIIPNEVTAGLNTVAVRMPNNKIALNLIKYSGLPIAAPSANISGKPSATCFIHVLDDFNGKIAGIIKSKDCKIGLESTVIDLTTKKPILLRPGGITYESLKKIIPNIQIAKNKAKKVKSPGMKYKHYAPDAKVILFEKSAYDKINFFIEKFKKQNKKFLFLEPKKIKDFHKKMFKIFRDCDKKGIKYILVSAVEEKGINLALMNRLRKSASKIIK